MLGNEPSFCCKERVFQFELKELNILKFYRFIDKIPFNKQNIFKVQRNEHGMSKKLFSETKAQQFLKYERKRVGNGDEEY